MITFNYLNPEAHQPPTPYRVFYKSQVHTPPAHSFAFRAESSKKMQNAGQIKNVHHINHKSNRAIEAAISVRTTEKAFQKAIFQVQSSALVREVQSLREELREQQQQFVNLSQTRRRGRIQMDGSLQLAKLTLDQLTKNTLAREKEMQELRQLLVKQDE